MATIDQAAWRYSEWHKPHARDALVAQVELEFRPVRMRLPFWHRLEDALFRFYLAATGYSMGYLRPVKPAKPRGHFTRGVNYGPDTINVGELVCWSDYGRP